MFEWPWCWHSALVSIKTYNGGIAITFFFRKQLTGQKCHCCCVERANWHSMRTVPLGLGKTYSRWNVISLCMNWSGFWMKFSVQENTSLSAQFIVSGNNMNKWQLGADPGFWSLPWLQILGDLSEITRHHCRKKVERAGHCSWTMFWDSAKISAGCHGLLCFQPDRFLNYAGVFVCIVRENNFDISGVETLYPFRNAWGETKTKSKQTKKKLLNPPPEGPPHWSRHWKVSMSICARSKS